MTNQTTHTASKWPKSRGYGTCLRTVPSSRTRTPRTPPACASLMLAFDFQQLLRQWPSLAFAIYAKSTMVAIWMQIVRFCIKDSFHVCLCVRHSCGAIYVTSVRLPRRSPVTLACWGLWYWPINWHTMWMIDVVFRVRCCFPAGTRRIELGPGVIDLIIAAVINAVITLTLC